MTDEENRKAELIQAVSKGLPVMFERTRSDALTGGVLRSSREKIPGAFIGKKVAFEREKFLSWFSKKIKLLEDDHQQ